jgi:hypothetical protein
MFKEIMVISTSLLTPIIAAMAVYIARQQWRTNHLKLKYDLYERRLAVYYAAMDFLACIIRNAKPSDEEMLTFLRKTRDTCFLFDSKLADYIEELFKKSCDLRAQDSGLHEQASDMPVGKERTRLVEENTKLLKWYCDQSNLIRDKFAKYMSLS